jgi:hypothetical protein
MAMNTTELTVLTVEDIDWILRTNFYHAEGGGIDYDLVPKAFRVAEEAIPKLDAYIAVQLAGWKDHLPVVIDTEKDRLPLELVTRVAANAKDCREGLRMIAAGMLLAAIAQARRRPH